MAWLGGIKRMAGAAVPMALAALCPSPALADSFRIEAPPIIGCGAPFWITVVALDAAGDTKTDYCGTVSLTSTDPLARIEGIGMDAYNYTWSSSIAPCGSAPFANGVKLFVNVVLPRPGPTAITVSDTVVGATTGLLSVEVICADVKLWGTPAEIVAASGMTVRFRPCWSNYSTGSAFDFVITNAVPSGATFLPEASVAELDGGNTAGVPLTVSYSTSAVPAMPPAASFITGNPIAGTRWLRWTVPIIGNATTGCGCFRAKVN